MENIRHISFDLWMTLIRTHPVYKGERAALFRTWFQLEDLPLERVEAVFREVDLLVNDMNEVTGRNVHTFEIYLLCLHKLGRDIRGIREEQLTGYYDAAEKLFLQYPPIPMYEDLTTLFVAIRKGGRTLSLLSNTGFIQGRTLRKIMQQWGWDQHFSFQLFSDEANVSKPSPVFFNALLENARQLHGSGLQPEHIWHLGDNPLADVQGAERAGMRATLTILDKQPLDKLLQQVAFDHA